MGVPLGMLLATGVLALCTFTLTERTVHHLGMASAVPAQRRVDRRRLLHSKQGQRVTRIRRTQGNAAPRATRLSELCSRKHPKQVVLAALSFIGTNGNGYMVIGGFIVAYATKTYGLGKTELLIATLASARHVGRFSP